MNQDRLKYLLELYAAKTATDEELDEFFTQVNKTSDAQMGSLLTDMLETTEPQFDESRRQRLLDKILRSAKNNSSIEPQQAPLRRMYPPNQVGGRVWTRIAAASVIVLLLSVGAYFYFNNTTQKQLAKTETQQHPLKNDIAPGGNKAILTLANGKQIILDSAANGTLTQQGNTKIIKLDSGQLAYRESGSPLGDGGSVAYNTITTPKGGQYQIGLADGSKVWLNATSSIKFPTAFNGKERNVELTGEGYFEVAHDAKKPFKVSVNGMNVQVLGTHFNINAYNDEDVIKTTLLEGSVKLSKGGLTQMLKPGQQAILRQAQDPSTGSGEIKVMTVDVDEAIAWKNGRFIFQGNNIQSVMRQLARWYNVEVSYQGNITDEEFVGVINKSRYENISQILDMLEKTRTVSFTINGHNVTVMPFKK